MRISRDEARTRERCRGAYLPVSAEDSKMLRSLNLPAALVIAAALMSRGSAPRADDPCAFKEIDVAKWGRKPLQNPPEVHSAGGKLQMKLAVKYTSPATTSIAGCPVTLRSYNGQLVGPTIRLEPGDALDLLFENQLPKESAKEIEAQYQQQASQAFIDHAAALVQHQQHALPRAARVSLGIQRQRAARPSRRKRACRTT